MLKNGLRIFTRLISLFLVLGLLSLILPRLITALHAWTRIYQPDDAPARRVAIVFGAGLMRDGRPAAVLRDRITTAARLYFDGKVEKLLMSGDNRFIDYNEPGAMRAYALELGVPEEAIVLDFAGRRTYDSCYRARQIFEVDEAILVTQGFHLPRALYLCNSLGVRSVGVPSDLREYRQRSLLFWNLREMGATLVALIEVNLTRPLPLLGNPEPIFSTEAG